MPLWLLRGTVNVMSTRYSLLLALAVAVGGIFVYGACSSDDAVTEGTPDAGPGSSSGNTLPDAGTLPDGAAKDCYDNPTTHFEIINACTDADKITRNPSLAKLLPDGGLPALP